MKVTVYCDIFYHDLTQSHYFSNSIISDISKHFLLIDQATSPLVMLSTNKVHRQHNEDGRQQIASLPKGADQTRRHCEIRRYVVIYGCMLSVQLIPISEENDI